MVAGCQPHGPLSDPHREIVARIPPPRRSWPVQGIPHPAAERRRAILFMQRFRLLPPPIRQPCPTVPVARRRAARCRTRTQEFECPNPPGERIFADAAVARVRRDGTGAGIRKHSGRPRIPEFFLPGARKRAPPTPCAEPAAQGKTRSVRKNAASAATRQVIEIRHVAPAGRGPMRFFDRSASAILADRRKKDREKTMPTFAESPIFCYLCFLKQNDLWQTRNSR